jgi:hypothetical protein
MSQPLAPAHKPCEYLGCTNPERCDHEPYWYSDAVSFRPWDSRTRKVDEGGGAGLWDGLEPLARERQHSDHGDAWRKSPPLTGNAYGFLDVDGTWCSAEESSDHNHGRKRRVAGGWHEAAERVTISRTHDPVTDFTQGLLARILWLERELVNVERDGIRARPGKRLQGGKRLLGEQLALARSVNVKHLADTTGIQRRSLTRWRDKEVTHSFPKYGETESMSTRTMGAQTLQVSPRHHAPGSRLELGKHKGRSPGVPLRGLGKECYPSLPLWLRNWGSLRRQMLVLISRLAREL